MHTFILQDWTTIRGTSGSSITQGEAGWIDLTAYQDAVFWVDVREITGTTVTMTLQTSPTKDDSLFTGIVSAFTPTQAAKPLYRLSWRKSLMPSGS